MLLGECRMNRTRDQYSVIVRRRYFLRSIIGLAFGAAVAELPSGAEQSAGAASMDTEYLIVNGWVLTREDVASFGTKLNAI
jgi:hypothetical protein